MNDDIFIVRDSNIFKNHVQKLNQKKNNEEIYDMFNVIFNSHDLMMQLRFIDKEGNERIKIIKDDYNGKSYFVDKNNLQNKKNRYYFKETINLNKNQVWLSNIDLNVEQGKVVEPFQPTIRIGTPVYVNSKKEGVLIINLFVKPLIAQLIHSELFKISLFDKDGNFIHYNKIDNSGSQDMSWNKYLNKKVLLKNYFSEEYNILNQSTFSKDGIYSKDFSNIIGLPEGLVMVLEPIKDKIEDFNDINSEYIFLIATVIFIISIPIALILAAVPDKITKELNLTKLDLNNSTFLLEEYKRAVDESNIVSKSDLNGTITYVNDKFCEVSQYSRDEVVGQDHSLLRSEDTQKGVFKELWKTIKNKKTWKGTLKNKKKDGTFYYIDITILPILDSQGNILEYIAIRHEITDLINKKEDLEKLLYLDTLTQNGNRNRLYKDLDQMNHPSAAIIDIDHFGELNDFYGIAIGDKIIKKVSEKINHLIILKNFKFYRIFGDRFILIDNSKHKDEFESFVNVIGSTLNSSKLQIDDEEISINVSCCISHENKENLLKTLEMARKFSKENKQSIVTYSTEMNLEKVYQKNISWTLKLKEGLANNQIVPFFQPIWNNQTNKIEKYECLVRYIEKDGSVISPYFFLDVAKKSKQYLSLTKKMFDNAFEYFKDKEFEFSINLTIEDILSKELSSYIIKRLAGVDFSKRVVFELVESEGIDNFEEVITFINEVKSLGAKVAIDDFGTGYSNFEYLIQLDADYIKIDGSMIRDIDVNKNSELIVKTIVSFAKHQGFKVIAEFVSSESILNKVKELGIEYSQGFYLGEPKDKIL